MHNCRGHRSHEHVPNLPPVGVTAALDIDVVQGYTILHDMLINKPAYCNTKTISQDTIEYPNECAPALRGSDSSTGPVATQPSFAVGHETRSGPGSRRFRFSRIVLFSCVRPGLCGP